MAVWTIEKRERTGLMALTYHNLLTGVEVPKIELNCPILAFMYLAKSGEWEGGDIVLVGQRVYQFSTQRDARA